MDGGELGVSRGGSTGTPAVAVKPTAATKKFTLVSRTDPSPGGSVAGIQRVTTTSAGVGNSTQLKVISSNKAQHNSVGLTNGNNGWSEISEDKLKRMMKGEAADDEFDDGDEYDGDYDESGDEPPIVRAAGLTIQERAAMMARQQQMGSPPSRARPSPSSQCMPGVKLLPKTIASSSSTSRPSITVGNSQSVSVAAKQMTPIVVGGGPPVNKAAVPLRQPAAVPVIQSRTGAPTRMSAAFADSESDSEYDDEENDGMLGVVTFGQLDEQSTGRPVPRIKQEPGQHGAAYQVAFPQNDPVYDAMMAQKEAQEQSGGAYYNTNYAGSYSARSNQYSALPRGGGRSRRPRGPVGGADGGLPAPRQRVSRGAFPDTWGLSPADMKIYNQHKPSHRTISTQKLIDLLKEGNTLMDIERRLNHLFTYPTLRSVAYRYPDHVENPDAKYFRKRFREEKDYSRVSQKYGIAKRRALDQGLTETQFEQKVGVNRKKEGAMKEEPDWSDEDAETVRNKLANSLASGNEQSEGEGVASKGASDAESGALSGPGQTAGGGEARRKPGPRRGRKSVNDLSGMSDSDKEVDVDESAMYAPGVDERKWTRGRGRGAARSRRSRGAGGGAGDGVAGIERDFNREKDELDRILARREYQKRRKENAEGEGTGTPATTGGAAGSTALGGFSKMRACNIARYAPLPTGVTKNEDGSLDVPIFTPEFLHHVKVRHRQLIRYQRELNALKRMNAGAEKKTASLSEASSQLRAANEKQVVVNEQFRAYLDETRARLTECFADMDLDTLAELSQDDVLMESEVSVNVKKPELVKPTLFDVDSLLKGILDKTGSVRQRGAVVQQEDDEWKELRDQTSSALEKFEPVT